jgi:beta-lactamase class A
MPVMRTCVLALAALLLAACASGRDESSPTPTRPPVLAGGPASPQATPDATASPTGSPSPAPTPQLVSLDWLAGDLSVPGLDAAPAAPAVDSGLEDAVNSALASFSGQASVVVHNLADGRYTALNESKVWYAASTFKAAILLTAYQQRDAGTLDFDKQVVLEDKYAEDDLGTLDYLHLKAGDLVTIRDAVKGMIVVSDTPLAVLMQDQVGGNNVDAALRSIGAETMSVNSHDLPTTALDLAELMIAMAAGQGVTAESRDEMLGLMAQEWFTDGIVAGLPAGTQYAHKSGSYGPNIHDAAIVWGPAGPYVIVVMTDGSAGWDPIAAVSSAVWDYFSANP